MNIFEIIVIILFLLVWVGAIIAVVKEHYEDKNDKK